MSGDRPATDPGEREIDLRKWRDALLACWWIAVAGLVAGIVVGALYSLSGGSTFTATALIAPGEAFNPSGSTPVQTYLTSESAINTIATSNSTLTQAAAEAKVGIGRLRGNVTTAAINENTGSTTTTSRNSAVLIQITAQLDNRTEAQDAANAIAEIVAHTTTSPYIRQSLSIIASEVTNFEKRLVSEKRRLDATNAELARGHLSLTNNLLLSAAADTALANYDETQQSLLTTQQEQILSKQVETTQIIQPALAQKTTARSRRNSVAVGAVIGLILGAIVATYVGLRGASRRVAPA